MRAGRRASTAWAILLLALLLAAPVSGDEGDARAASFERALERIHEQLKKERFEPALQALEKLLKTHPRTPYAWSRRAELEDLAFRLAFGRRYGAPSAADVVSGRLLSWDRQTGYISIIYTPGNAADLKRSGGMWQFPPRIRGSFLLQIYGKEYPYTTDDAPQVAFGGDPHPGTKEPQSWHLIFGMPRYVEGDMEVWLPASIVHRDGAGRKKIPASGPTGAKRGKPFKLQLKVTEIAIGAGLNGKTWGRARKPRGVWGTLAFSAPGWDRMAFTGTIEPAWIQSRLDQVVQRQLSEFKRSYQPSDVLPAWLFERGPAAAPETVQPQAEFPVALASEHSRALHHYRSHVKAGRWRSALSAVEKLRKAGAPGATCDFMAARAHFELGLVKQGLVEVERVLEAEPSYLPALLLRGRLHRRRGASDEALQAFQHALEQYGSDPAAYETAVVSMLRAGRPEAAERLMAQAEAAGALTEELGVLSRVLVKARLGPTWNQTFEYKSRNYHVLSDIDKPTCKLACDLLEEAHTSYRVNLHWTPGTKGKRFKVYLFNGQAGFLEYWKELEGYAGQPHLDVGGWYSPILKQLLIWHLPNREKMLEAIRHEGFHQYLDRFMPDPPIWLNEGLAVYHQKARRTVNGLQFGQARPEYLEALSAQGRQRMAAFLGQTHREFSERGLAAYGQAWAFVHMLRHGKQKYRAIFQELVEALQTEPGGEVVERLFPRSLHGALAADFQAHLKGLH